MSGELMQYVGGEVTPRYKDRPVAKRAKKVHDRVREAGFKADGSLALGAHIMEGVVDLVTHRRELAGEDVYLNAVLTGVEQDTISHARHIQRSMYSGWGL